MTKTRAAQETSRNLGGGQVERCGCNRNDREEKIPVAETEVMAGDSVVKGSS